MVSLVFGGINGKKGGVSSSEQQVFIKKQFLRRRPTRTRRQASHMRTKTLKKFERK